MAIPGRPAAAPAAQQEGIATTMPPVAADKFSKILSKVQDVKQSVSKCHAALFWGKTKTGKTTLAATYPKPLLLLDIFGEYGTASIQNVEGVKVVSIETWEEFELWYQYLRWNPDHGYKTIVMDTITKLQDLALAHVLTQRRVSITTSKTQKDWGDAATILKVYLQYYKDLTITNNMYVVMLAQYKESELKNAVTTRQVVPCVGAALMPSVAGFVESIVSLIGWVHVDMIPLPDPNNPKQLKDQLKHCIVVKPDGIYSTGIRLPGINVPCPDRIIDPTFEKIDAIMSQVEAAKEKAQ